MWGGQSINREKFWKKVGIIFFIFFFINTNPAIFRIGLKQKNYFDLTKIFISRLFKTPANQTEYFKLELGFVTKFLVAGKNKPCKIYRRIYDVDEEACLNKKLFRNK